ncbi:MAG TPA: DUF3105 domain-containing protein [Candidatus Limnocylindrales bacterium]|nr:DUF3105 domain-containing protein [Candidatus Limnocylindrales bacterium]
MAKRRTSGIQRRERASGEALNRRLDAGGGGASLPDWRLLAIGGVLLVGVAIIALVIVLGGPEDPSQAMLPNDGSAHVAPGTTCRSAEAPCGADPYSTLPAASGPHWDPSGIASWGVYSTPQNESQVIHNLEHGGIVIWYDPDILTDAQVAELTSYVEGQVSSGISGRYKFILTPWGGTEDLGAAVAVTAWRHLLKLDAFDMDAVRSFADDNYLRFAPEPNGGPGPP